MAIEIVDFPIKNCDFPIKHGDFPLKIVIFPLKMVDLSIANRSSVSSARRPLLPGNSFHSWCCDHTKSSSCPSRSALKRRLALDSERAKKSGNIKPLYTTFNILQSISWFINEVNLIKHHQPNIPFAKSPNYPTQIPNISFMNPENYVINPEKKSQNSPNRFIPK